MQIIENIFTMKKHIIGQRFKDRTIGLVPTSGGLNPSHVEMVRRAKKENDITVLSIFVNIAQFESKTEYKKHPRDFESDYKIAEEAGADILFYPDTKSVWSSDSMMFADVAGNLAGTWARGTATVLMKFFSAVDPDRVYISQKDVQEIIIAERLVEEFYMSPNIITCPILREQSGLAVDNANEKLSKQERDQAALIHKALRFAVDEMIRGERNAKHLKKAITKFLEQKPLAAEIDHVAIKVYDTFRDSVQIKGKTVVSIGLRFLRVTIADNVIVEF